MQKVVSVSLMRESDRQTIENFVDSKELMARAGKALLESYEWHGKIAIVCGSGNNGGDGFVLAGLLQEKKQDVTVYLLSEKMTEDTAYFLQHCKEIGVKIKVFQGDSFQEYDVIADCIFGTGFRGSLDGVAREAVLRINESNAYVISADINSGLNGDNGLTDLAVKSDLTVSIGSLKTGHFLNMAKDVIGKLVNAEIGIELAGKPYYLAEQKDFTEILQRRKNYSNKGSYGRTAIIGGCLNYSGAVKLANLSCSVLRSGSGLVSVVVAKSLAGSVIPYLLESTLYPMEDIEGKMLFRAEELDKALKKVNSIVIGPGWGECTEYVKILRYILMNYAVNVLIDADGIAVLGKIEKEVLRVSKCKILMTPHPAEFSKISGFSIEEILASPIERAKVFAEKSGIIVLLKGTTTIITDGREVYLVNRGCPGMATAGSGDVLAGVIGGINAFHEENLLLNAVCGAYVAGFAGELAEEEKNSISMVASDTIGKIADAITRMGK